MEHSDEPIGQAALSLRKGPDAAGLAGPLLHAMGELCGPFLLVDEQSMRPVYVSEALSALTGASREDVLAATVLELFEPDERAKVAAWVSAGQNDGPTDLPTRILARERPVEVTLRCSRVDAPQGALRLVAVEPTRRPAPAEVVRAERLGQILDAIADGVTVQDHQGLFYANPAAAALLGYPTPQALVAAGVEGILSQCELVGEDGQRIQFDDAPGRMALSGRAPQPRVVRYRFVETGEERWLRVRAAPMFDVHGRRALSVTVFQDVTGLMRAEAAASASQERYLKAFSASPSALAISREADGLILEANGAWEELFGIAADEAVGRRSGELGVYAHPEDRERIVDHLRRDGFVRNLEVTIRRSTGELRWVLLSAEPIEVGGERCILSIAHDITGRRRAERALAAERERLRVTLASIVEGVIATDMRGRVTLVNSAAEELTGVGQGEAVGRPLEDVLRPAGGQAAAALLAPVRAVLESGSHFQDWRRVRIVGAGGVTRSAELSASPLRRTDQTFAGAVLVLRDVTERERLEAELVRAEKLESLGVLAGGIAHDFNNILTALLGNISVARLDLERGRLPVARLAEAERATQRAARLTHQLLTFASGGAPVRADIELQDLVRDTVGFALSGSRSRAEVDVDDSLWPVHADASQVAQVLQNLVLNASQAMPGGGVVTVRAANVRVEPRGEAPVPPGRWVRIAVGDQGPGIPEDVKDRIFDPFFTTKAGGTGLGLATAARIVGDHDGRLTAQTMKSGGACFQIWLPASEAAVARAESPARAIFGRGRILVMDDDAMVRELASSALDVLGYTVVTAASGDEALAAFERAVRSGDPFDAVILDLTVPGAMDGVEALERLRSLDPDVRAIVSSGYHDTPVMADHRRHGFAAVLRKPYTVQELGAVLAQVCR